MMLMEASEEFLRREHGRQGVSELALIKLEVPDDEAQA